MCEFATVSENPQICNTASVAAMIFCYLLSQLSMIKVTILYYLYCGVSASNEYFGSLKLTLAFFFFLITKSVCPFCPQL